MGIVVVSMRAARLASCKNNEADFRLKNYKSIFSYLAVRGIKPTEVFDRGDATAVLGIAFLGKNGN